jgi:hypothetical protein
MNDSCSFLLFAANRLSVTANRLSVAAKRVSDFNFCWLIYAIAIVAVVIALYFACHHLRKIRANSHSALFRDLCRLHELDSNSKKLLGDLAQHYQIDKPVRLFLEPSWLNQAQAGSVFPADAGLIDGLRAKLFG